MLVQNRFVFTCVFLVILIFSNLGCGSSRPTLLRVIQDHKPGQSRIYQDGREVVISQMANSVVAATAMKNGSEYWVQVNCVNLDQNQIDLLPNFVASGFNTTYPYGIPLKVYHWSEYQKKMDVENDVAYLLTSVVEGVQGGLDTVNDDLSEFERRQLQRQRVGDINNARSRGLQTANTVSSGLLKESTLFTGDSVQGYIVIASQVAARPNPDATDFRSLNNNRSSSGAKINANRVSLEIPVGEDVHILTFSN